ncbi:MAG: ferredoxin [Amaricoccus sp.]|nr:ferredoxin [Amaricoccus sp.]
MTVGGGLHPGPQDGAPPGTGTIVLLCPDGRAFWNRLRAAPEWDDGRPDPVDRWSLRVIGALAARLGARALFPFGGPPWLPFTAWARASEMAWEAPVGLLVHARLGLFVSYRGALAFPGRLDLPPPPARPCDACARPCLTACPVGALTGAGYDIAACHAFLDTAAGADCMERGCAVRRSCPVGAELRGEAQSAFHMASFHPRPAPGP